MARKLAVTKRQRGSSLVEFMLSTLVWVPLLVGAIGIGTEMVREIEVTQISRDAAHMHAYGVDFTLSGNKSLIVQAASSLGITATGGNGTIILSTIEMVSAADCQAAGLTADSSHCANLNHAVWTKRLVIGNSSFSSAFDNTGAPVTDSSGAVTQNRILNTAADRVDQFSQALFLQPGQLAYVGEVFVRNDDLAWTGFGGTSIYARSIF